MLYWYVSLYSFIHAATCDNNHLKDHAFHHQTPSDNQQCSIFTVGFHEGLRSMESSRLHVMVLLSNTTQLYHDIEQIVLTMLSHNLKVRYIVQDRPEELQTPGIWSPEAHMLLYCKTWYLVINPADCGAAQKHTCSLKTDCMANVCTYVCMYSAHARTGTSVLL